MWLVAPLTKLAAVSLPTLAPSIGNGMTGWRSGQPFCEIVHDKFEEQTKKIDTIVIKATKQKEVVFLSDAINVAIFFNSLVLTCGSKCVCQTTTPHPWPLSSTCSKDNVFFPTSYRFPANFKLLYWLYTYLLPLNMTLYIYTHICVHFEAHLSRSHSKVHIFKLHKRQVSSPWHGCDNRPHKSHQKRRGAMVFPEDETLASLDFLQSDLHLSWRRMMKFTSIGTIKNTGKHQPWSSFKRVVAEKATNNICE